MSSDIFTIGASGLKGYRAQMGAISENIANADTPNYSRRSVRLVESSVAASTSPIYNGRTNFGGTEIVSVNRSNDPYLDAAARLTGNTLGNADSRVRWLSEIESSLKDDSQGVGGTIANFYSSVTRLASSPADTSLRSNMIYALDQVSNAFKTSSDNLTLNQEGMYDVAQADATTVNNALTELSRINSALLRAQNGTSNQAQLLDSRDAQLTTISKKLNVDITFDAGGAATVKYGATNLVQGDSVNTISVTKNADYTLNFQAAGAAATAPSGGELGGIFQSATTAAQRMTSLDRLAVQFAGDVNAWHAQGLTDAGAAGGALLSVGATAASMAVAISGVAGVAAKSAGGVVNGNLLAISTTRNNSTVEQGWSQIVTAQANQLNTVKQEQASAQQRDDSARAAREGVSGVDLDTEAADLLRVQQAYQASARVIQAARDMTDAILRIS